MCFIYSSASLFSHTPITSLFPVFPFYRTTPFPLLLPFSVLPLCFQSTPTAAPICLLFCVHLLFLSSVNCSVNPLRVGLQFTLPQLHMSILPPLLLLFFFFYSGWDGAASSPGRQAGGELHEPGWEWSLPACLGHSCEEQNCLPLSVLLSLHIWCVGGTGPCCAVLFCPWRDTAAGFWPGHFVVGLDLRCKSAHCYAHTDEPDSFGYSKQWLLSQWINY